VTRPKLAADAEHHVRDSQHEQREVEPGEHETTLRPHADLVGIVARSAGEIPVGVVTALIGAPFFILLLRRARTGYEL